MNERDRAELRLLEQQLERMRGMLGAYSALFFRQITVWGVLCVALLALSTLAALAPAAAAVGAGAFVGSGAFVAGLRYGEGMQIGRAHV